MIRGLYTAATSMKVQMNRMDVISNNMANANTTSFKKDAIVQTAFSDELTKRISDLGSNNIGVMNNGVGTSNIVTNFEQGSNKQTGADFDIALQGKGFLCVDGNPEIKYTRNGSFALDAESYLITANGNYVLDVNDQRIKLPNGKLTIDESGKLFVNAEEQTQLKIIDFEDPSYLSKQGDSMYIAKEGAKETDFKGTVLQGSLEASNVNIVKEMVNMIALSRNYETNQKVIQAHDSLLDKAVNQVGRL